MDRYREAYSALNKAQKKAVDTIDGPVLVLAGPGTGKTQLLAVRVAHILSQTDTLPQNIVCLTFTESGQRAMRERLQRYIGQDAFHITISTYHAFASDILRKYPEYVEIPGQRPVDDLLQDQTLRTVLENLPYSNPLKNPDIYLDNIRSTISDAKRALLTPDDVLSIANATITNIQETSVHCQQSLRAFEKINKAAIPLFVDLCTLLMQHTSDTKLPASLRTVSDLAAEALHAALESVAETGKTNQLTKWKNTWLVKDHRGNFQLNGHKSAKRLISLAEIYQKYEAELGKNGLFDYDDMIIRAIRTIESNADLQMTLQEQYQYILLDEFQDTNAAQLRIIDLLTDNPVNEGRPNILAVGDDDQAIYAFQGASYSNMQSYLTKYRDVCVVPLVDNYRSHKDVLHVGHSIAQQIEERLHHKIEGIEKVLNAANKDMQDTAVVERHEFVSDAAELDWVADAIDKLIQQGVRPSDIAVLAPKHRFLEPLVPFLNERGIPSMYEKRENILDDPIIERLITMSKLVAAINANDTVVADELWATVLSFDFWNIPTSTIWHISWSAHSKREPWTKQLMDDPMLKPIALFFVRLSAICTEETLEVMIDYLIGVTQLELPGGEGSFTSPFYDYYFGSTAQEFSQDFWHSLSILTIVREKLREYTADDGIPKLNDLVRFIDAHRQAGIKIINSTPYRQSDKAVQIMTAYKSKGLEFEAVFVLACQDEVWGTMARTNTSKISLPDNLKYIRYAGATNDERLRLFYVALTRAKRHLYLTSYAQTFASKPTVRLSYLDEYTNDDGTISSNSVNGLNGTVHSQVPTKKQRLDELRHYWTDRHIHGIHQPSLRHLLQDRLAKFQLSATHINGFTDTMYGGPEQVFLNTILKFPKAAGVSGQYGNAFHETMQWIHIALKNNGILPDHDAILQKFNEQLVAKKLSRHHTALLQERGESALKVYLKARLHTFQPSDQHEYDFRNEGVMIGDAHMTGKIDKLSIDHDKKIITVYDYKTGTAYDKWNMSEAKLYKYRQQLIVYKLLIEGSHTFKGYTVDKGILEFVEPDENGAIQSLEYTYQQDEIDHIKRLSIAVWQHIMALDLPDISSYQPSTAGIKLFEQHLIEHANHLSNTTQNSATQSAILKK